MVIRQIYNLSHAKVEFKAKSLPRNVRKARCSICRSKNIAGKSNKHLRESSREGRLVGSERWYEITNHALSNNHQNLSCHLVLNRAQSNPAMARFKLSDIEARVEV